MCQCRRGQVLHHRWTWKPCLSELCRQLVWLARPSCKRPVGAERKGRLRDSLAGQTSRQQKGTSLECFDFNGLPSAEWLFSWNVLSLFPSVVKQAFPIHTNVASSGAPSGSKLQYNSEKCYVNYIAYLTALHRLLYLQDWTFVDAYWSTDCRCDAPQCAYNALHLPVHALFVNND